MLGTHNSGTGEASHWSCLWLVPFARCQSKTIIEQYESEVRYFDIRLIWDKDHWTFAHGLWKSKVDAENVLQELRMKALKDGENIYMRIWYEKLPNEEQAKRFYRYVYDLDNLDFFNIDNFGIKRLYENLTRYLYLPIKDCYHVLNLTKNKKALLPIPWLWWLFRTKDMRTMDEDKVNLCDFV